MLKDMIANFLEEMADFAGGRERRRDGRKSGVVPVRLYSRVESEAFSRKRDEGGKYRRRKDAFDFFDD